MTLLLGYKKQLVEDKYDLDQLMLIAQQKVDETTAGSLLLKSNNTIRIPSLMHTGTWRGKIGIQLRFGRLPYCLPLAPLKQPQPYKSNAPIPIIDIIDV